MCNPLLATCCKYRRIKPIKYGLILSGLLWTASDAMATVTCKVHSGSPVTLSAASVPVTADMPMGTVVYSQAISGITLKCARETLTDLHKNNQVMLIVPHHTAPTLPTTRLGLSAYITYNGVRTHTAEAIDTGIDGSAFPATGLLNIALTDVVIPGEILVEFVKTAATPARLPMVNNTLLAFGFSSIAGSASDAPVYINGMKGGFVIQAETCEINIAGSPDKTVLLPSISSQKMGGPGGTAGEARFTLRLQCLSSSPIPGTFRALMTLTGTMVSGLSGVLTNSGSATGVGVLIKDLNRDSVAAINTGAQYVGDYTSHVDIEIPFSASYFQTERQVGAGSVKSILSYTFTYE